LGTTYQGLYNPNGRAFPDVAAVGNNLPIINAGVVTGVAGTSCSSPVFAATIGLLNDLLFAKGKAPLGFLNPWLYANPGMFNDITTGNNGGCNTNGFSAKAGWDPVSF
jgi:tripeptidyl-peptidase-1